MGISHEQITATARDLYERTRQKNSGRPPWDQLDPDDPDDCGMRRRAFRQARRLLGLPTPDDGSP